MVAYARDVRHDIVLFICLDERDEEDIVKGCNEIANVLEDIAKNLKDFEKDLVQVLASALRECDKDKNSDRETNEQAKSIDLRRYCDYPLLLKTGDSVYITLLRVLKKPDIIHLRERVYVPLKWCGYLSCDKVAVYAYIVSKRSLEHTGMLDELLVKLAKSLKGIIDKRGWNRVLVLVRNYTFDYHTTYGVTAHNKSYYMLSEDVINRLMKKFNLIRFLYISCKEVVKEEKSFYEPRPLVLLLPSLEGVEVNKVKLGEGEEVKIIDCLGEYASLPQKLLQQSRSVVKIVPNEPKYSDYLIQLAYALFICKHLVENKKTISFDLEHFKLAEEFRDLKPCKELLKHASEIISRNLDVVVESLFKQRYRDTMILRYMDYDTIEKLGQKFFNELLRRLVLTEQFSVEKLRIGYDNIREIIEKIIKHYLNKAGKVNGYCQINLYPFLMALTVYNLYLNAVGDIKPSLTELEELSKSGFMHLSKTCIDLIKFVSSTFVSRILVAQSDGKNEDEILKRIKEFMETIFSVSREDVRTYLILGLVVGLWNEVVEDKGRKFYKIINEFLREAFQRRYVFDACILSQLLFLYALKKQTLTKAWKWLVDLVGKENIELLYGYTDYINYSFDRFRALIHAVSNWSQCRDVYRLLDHIDNKVKEKLGDVKDLIDNRLKEVLLGGCPFVLLKQLITRPQKKQEKFKKSERGFVQKIFTNQSWYRNFHSLE